MEKQQNKVHVPKGVKPDSAQSNDSPQQGNLAEIGGPKGPEPTRYGDWEKKGRCIDF